MMGRAKKGIPNGKKKDKALNVLSFFLPLGISLLI